jgi:paraquat-inducible protein B
MQRRERRSGGSTNIADDPPAEDGFTPIVKRRRGVSPIWIIPTVTALLGFWLIAKHYVERGPEITVRFETAEGANAGKTPVLYRNVNIGTVSSLRLTDDSKGVIVTMRMTREATKLLRQDSEFWMVRLRFGGGGISGLGTLVSGTYVALEPGISREPRRDFVGREEPPVMPKGVPGLHLKLMANEAGGIAPGSAILYKGLNAGKIETRVFRPESGKVEFGAFIQIEYARLVRPETKFWDTSGIGLQIGPTGVNLHTGILEKLLGGAITFSEPKAETSSMLASDNAVFTLYDNFEEAQKPTLQTPLPYLLLFSDSVRGLHPDASVEFRGIAIGRVEGVSFAYLPNDPEHRVPVLIQIDPSLVTSLPPNDPIVAEDFIEQNVARGLRASLKSGSPLGGQPFIELSFQEGVRPDSVVDVAGYKILPTAPSQLEELQKKAIALTEKAAETLTQIKSAAQNFDKTVSGFNEKSVFYQDLTDTMRQLDQTMRSLHSLSETLERKPNSLIFGKPGRIPPPKGRQP